MRKINSLIKKILINHIKVILCSKTTATQIVNAVELTELLHHKKSFLFCKAKTEIKR